MSILHDALLSSSLHYSYSSLLAVMSEVKVRNPMGNYKGYYSQRADSSNRLQHFQKKWICNKKCIDIGCNSGHFTFVIAEKFGPKSIVGLDIDPDLISRALARLANTPVVRASTSGALVPRAIRLKTERSTPYPLNMSFKCCDIMQRRGEEVIFSQQFDTVICCSLSKWVHLNHGDSGLLVLFQTMFDLLAPGGLAIFEYQHWRSYENNKNVSATTKLNFSQIRIRPEQFEEILTDRIGFVVDLRTGTPLADAKGFNRPILVLSKPCRPRNAPVELESSREAVAGTYGCVIRRDGASALEIETKSRKRKSSDILADQDTNVDVSCRNGVIEGVNDHTSTTSQEAHPGTLSRAGTEEKEKRRLKKMKKSSEQENNKSNCSFKV